MKRSLRYALVPLVAAVVLLLTYLFADFAKSFSAPPSLNAQDNLERSTNPENPLLFREGALLNEEGQMEEDGLSNALSQLDRYVLAHQPTSGFGDDGLTRGLDWKPRGPQNVGGRTRTLAVDSDNPSILYAGAATGGVWKSFDKGKTWTALNHELANFAIASIAIDPGNHQTIFVGTGDSFNVPLLGNGVFRSTQGGIGWEHLGGTTGWRYVNSIAVERSGNNTVVLAAVGESNEYGAYGNQPMEALTGIGD